MALQLIYLTVSRLLGWMFLHARSDTAKEIEILVRATNSPSSNDALQDPGSPGLPAPTSPS